MRVRSGWRLVIQLSSVVVLVYVGSCGGPAGEPGAESGARQQPISGGTADTTDTAVVGIIERLSGTMADLCSGTLIAPNAVLTARHCVSDLDGLEMSTTVDCRTATVGPVRPAGNFFVTTASPFPRNASGYRRVSEIVILPDAGGDLCGADVAILILSENVPASEATPLQPAAINEVTPGDIFSIVGYGKTSSTADDAGTRHRRDGLRVRCADSGCNTSQVVTAEFSGETGICPGDSGGPALDGSGVVIGVASRSGDGCSTSIFQTVADHIDWIRDTVIHAASLGGYAPPDWTTAPDASATAPTTAFTDNTGCRVAAGPRSLDGALLLLSLAVVVRRRRSTGATSA